MTDVIYTEKREKQLEKRIADRNDEITELEAQVAGLETALEKERNEADANYENLQVRLKAARNIVNSNRFHESKLHLIDLVDRAVWDGETLSDPITGYKYDIS